MAATSQRTPGPLYLNGEFIYSAPHRDAVMARKNGDRSNNDAVIPVAKIVNGNLADAALFVAAHDMLEALYQYESDLLLPPSQVGREDRLDRVRKIIAAAEARA